MTVKSEDQFGSLLRQRRRVLGFTQRSLARVVGIESSHIAFLESGRRKPSLKLLTRLADALALNRQQLLLLTHPEVEALLSSPSTAQQHKTGQSWRNFSEDAALLQRYQVTRRELEVLEHLSLLGSALSPKQFIAILTLLRNGPETE